MNNRQKLFVKEYLVDLNATRAAKSAGYSERTAYSAGQRLLKHVEVSAAIAQKTEKLAQKLDISVEYVLGTIKQTIERCSQGVEVLDREGNPTGEWKEDSFAVLKGCELLGKYLKLFTEKVEHTGTVTHEHIDLSPYSDDQLAQIEALVESAHAGANQG
jgi:phage terminase small subunit